ncbi:MAG: hypothetical protein FWC17_04650, partial [Treponema sp.]|nr:hypothetical protein [Treponema sp.]
MQSDCGYAYAKAGGIIGKSFLGKRITLLSGLRTLGDLDDLIFSGKGGGTRSAEQGKQLLAELERKITERALSRILSVVKSFS